MSCSRLLVLASLLYFFVGHSFGHNKFPGAPNGNIAEGLDVSPLTIRSQYPALKPAKILVHYTPWWGNGRVRGVDPGYNSNDAAYISRLLHRLDRLAIDGLIIEWFHRSDFGAIAAQSLVRQIENFPSQRFVISLDRGLLRNDRCSGCTLTESAIDHIKFLMDSFLSHQQYLRINGQPVVLSFGLESEGPIDWAKIAAKFPDVALVHIHKAGFDRTASKGAFVWPMPRAIDACWICKFMNEPWSQFLEEFYSRAKATKGQSIVVGAAFKGFDDHLAPWAKSAPRKIEQSCGGTWLKSLAMAENYVRAGGRLDILQLVTWNDFEEGSALEFGADGCIEVKLDLNGNDVRIAISHPQNVAHIEIVLRQRDGLEVRMSKSSAEISYFSIPREFKGRVDVKAIGKPHLLNGHARMTLD